MVARVAFQPGPGLALLFGYHEENLRQLETATGVRLTARGNEVTVRGSRPAVGNAVRVLERMRDSRGPLTPDGVRRLVSGAGGRGAAPAADEALRTPREVIVPRGDRQAEYLKAIRECDVVFGVGPAGTGKTFLAVGCALAAFTARRVERIVLVRPVVEAGERLGFLPGDMREKVDPYLRPLYDALYDVLAQAKVERDLETGVIEIAPLAFMRGRTLAHSFVILDEAQNSTSMQMKMFLTRIGEGSKMVVTGDPSQIDLPPGQRSGLEEAVGLLDGVRGIEAIRFTSGDVVRRDLVARIVEAYDKAG